MEPDNYQDAQLSRILEYLRANAATLRAILNADADAGAPIAATVSNTPEVPREVPSALCCIDEDELDDWWTEQDVEVKADAFLRSAFSRCASYIYCGERFREPGIPVIGTAGETPEQWTAIAKRVAEQAQAVQS